jgi:hypothetical protein
MFEMLLIKAIRGFFSCFSNPMSEFLTYHSEVFSEESAHIQRRVRDCTREKYKPEHTRDSDRVILGKL